MVTGPFLIFSTGWLEFVLQVDWNWCYTDMMVRGPFLVFSTGWLELVLQRPDGHRTIPCFLHRLTGIHSIGVTLTDMRWSQDRSFSPQVDWTWCYRHTMVTGIFLVFCTGWLELVLQWSQDHSLFFPQGDWNWCYRHTMVTGPFLVFSTGWLELVLQTHDGHRTIPCFLHRLTGICVTDTQWSQDHSLFTLEVDWSWCSRHTMVTGPFLVFSTGWLEFVLQVDWNWCYRDMMVRGPFLVFSIQRHDGQRTIPCFLHRLTGIGVTETWWSQDHSLFSPQADWNSLNWCYTYRHALVTGLIIFSTGSLDLVYLTDTWWTQDHSLFSPQVDWNWVLQTHSGHRTIPCLPCRLTGVGVTDTRWPQDHSLFSPQVDWNWCYRDMMVTGPFLVFSTGWLEFTQLVLHLQTCVGHRTDRFFSTGSLELVYLTDTWWSQDHSLFSPQADELVLQIHIGHRTIPCFLHRLTVYTSVCFETKWPGDFICPFGGVLTNVSVVCMVSSYLLGIVLCLLVRLWAQTGLPVPLECQGKIVSHLCFSTACLTDP